MLGYTVQARLNGWMRVLNYEIGEWVWYFEIGQVDVCCGHWFVGQDGEGACRCYLWCPNLINGVICVGVWCVPHWIFIGLNWVLLTTTRSLNCV